ncbi:hypothetical protein CEQ90_05585 [Lewinellaceae bacterium SD302]|nr:hypothetical protein CEQ90_05585 [Lewinellaceae bacterium SD302]
MFKNYLKLAFKVLGRRKFFTFVSLFGISFTLMVLMVIMAFLDTELGANAPMSEADRMVLMDRVEFKTQFYDTIYQVDSQLVAGKMTYDTVNFETEEAGAMVSQGSPGLKLFRDHLEAVEPYEHFAAMFRRSFDVFQDGRKYSLSAKYADADYWKILDFNFLEGTPFNSNHVESATSVAVVTDRMAREFFGTDENVTGRELTLSGRTFEVIGVVERSRTSSVFTRADIYLPMSTADNQTLSSESLQGPFRGIFLAPSVNDVKQLQDNLHFAGRNVPIPPDMDDFENITIKAFTVEEKYAWNLFFDDEVKKSLSKFRWILFGTLGFFLLIPTLNLINLNLSRMVERSSEISVRKAFGADSRHILVQFLFENIIITLVGGTIGFLLALLVIYLINQSGALPDTILSFNWRVFGISLIICLGFGFLSGLLPAYRMSRQQVADGL